MRSHPPSLLRTVERALIEEARLAPGTGVLVAVSGGPDSMALLHVLSLLSPRLGFPLGAHGVDHGLRSEAGGELDLVAQFAETLGVPFSRTTLCVERGGNLQARARAGRYDALTRAAEDAGLALIATAHHAEDRAETVLIRLLRGAGPAGLAVLPVLSPGRLRPMIRATRRDVELHLGRHGVPSCRDPSNHDPRFLRVRVRKELLPLLGELSPGIVGHLNALADQLEVPAEPLLRDPSGRVVLLGRAQRNELRRARQRGNGARVRLSDDCEAVVGPGGVPEVRSAPPRSR